MKKTFGMLMMGLLSLSLLVSMPTFAQEEVKDVGGMSTLVVDNDYTMNMVEYRATGGYEVSYVNMDMDFTFEAAVNVVLTSAGLLEEKFICIYSNDTNSKSLYITAEVLLVPDLTVSNKRLCTDINQIFTYNI